MSSVGVDEPGDAREARAERARGHRVDHRDEARLEARRRVDDVVPALGRDRVQHDGLGLAGRRVAVDLGDGEARP